MNTITLRLAAWTKNEDGSVSLRFVTETRPKTLDDISNEVIDGLCDHFTEEEWKDRITAEMTQNSIMVIEDVHSRAEVHAFVKKNLWK